MILKLKDVDGNWVSVPAIRGEDGLTTSVTLNGELIEQEDGNIDLGELAVSEDGKGLSSNDYTDEDKDYMETLSDHVAVDEDGNLSLSGNLSIKTGYVDNFNGTITTDLDALIEPGQYSVNSETINNPANGIGLLEVKRRYGSSGFTVQIVYGYNSKMYFRSTSSTTTISTSWVEVS